MGGRGPPEMDAPGSKLSTTCLLFQHPNSMPLGLIGGGTPSQGAGVPSLPHPTPFPCHTTVS